MSDQTNKTWKNEGRYSTYNDALSNLVSLTGDHGNRETETHLYKIKFMNSDEHYVIKSWTKPTKQETKKDKNSRIRNKKKKNKNRRSQNT